MRVFADPVRRSVDQLRSPRRSPVLPARPLPERTAVRNILHGPRVQPRAQPQLTVGPIDDGYEREADTLGEAVTEAPEVRVQRACADGQEERVQRQLAGPLAPRSEPVLSEDRQRELREAMCIGIPSGQGPARCQFTRLQRAQVAASLAAARSVASRVLVVLRSNPAQLRGLAERIFHISNPDMAALTATARQILAALGNTPVVCGTCSDPDCNPGSVAAFVPPDLGSIVICPFFFEQHPSVMRKTMLHEAGHVARIDDRPNFIHPTRCAESNTINCDDPCENIPDLLHNVDAWARFMECAALS